MHQKALPYYGLQISRIALIPLRRRADLVNREIGAFKLLFGIEANADEGFESAVDDEAADERDHDT